MTDSRGLTVSSGKIPRPIPAIPCARTRCVHSAAIFSAMGAPRVVPARSERSVPRHRGRSAGARAMQSIAAGKDARCTCWIKLRCLQTESSDDLARSLGSALRDHVRRRRASRACCDERLRSRGRVLVHVERSCALVLRVSSVAQARHATARADTSILHAQRSIRRAQRPRCMRARVAIIRSGCTASTTPRVGASSRVLGQRGGRGSRIAARRAAARARS